MTDHFVDPTKMVEIKPLPELVYRLRAQAPYGNLDGGTKRELHLIDAAYRAGADAELQACCTWLSDHGWIAADPELRAARRPKPPSLKEQALAAWDTLRKEAWCEEIDYDLDIIRHALEKLND